MVFSRMFLVFICSRAFLASLCTRAFIASLCSQAFFFASLCSRFNCLSCWGEIETVSWVLPPCFLFLDLSGGLLPVPWVILVPDGDASSSCETPLGTGCCSSCETPLGAGCCSSCETPLGVGCCSFSVDMVE